MSMIQEIIDIEKMDLLNKVLDMKNAGYRLAQICATKFQNNQSFILLYSFIKDEKDEKDERFITLRFAADISDTVESIGWLYSYAFLYENEIKDLFGINILNMNLDFKGHFYETSVKTPFNPENPINSINSINPTESEVTDNG